MVRFLIQRPIAVLMAFTACFIIGLVTYFTIPVSLLPDIAIPEITVQVAGQNTSARELENTLVKPIRQQLMQVAGLRDIHSETRDGNGVIRLSFDFGTNTDLAFIEVNEKIDAAMSMLPREVERPRGKGQRNGYPGVLPEPDIKRETRRNSLSGLVPIC